MTKYKKLVPWVIVTLFVLWIISTESPYQKGGTGPIFSLCVPGFVFLIAILIGMRYDNFKIIERLAVGTLCSVVVLLLISVLVTPNIIAFFYDDKTWYFWETKHRLIINTIYYGLNGLLLWLFINSYFSVRTLQRNHSKKEATVL